MLINKILLKISHFFGFRLDEEHMTDITINISTNYYNTDAIDEIHSNKCKSIEAKLIMEDIFSKIYTKFESDKILEKRCRNVKQVWVTYYQSDIEFGDSGGSIITTIPYVDGTLHNPFDKSVMSALERQRKIDNLLK